jgi:NADH pyrophosphatase NudC (nudix superfamily)
MLVTAIGLALVVAAAFFVAWPMLSPAAADAAGEASDPARESEAAASRAALARRRDAALAALKEAEFDHQVGKLSDEDHAALRSELETRALEAIAALDAADAIPRHDAGIAPRAARTTEDRSGGFFCAACGHPNPGGARFCAACGAAGPATPEPSRRRA